MENALVSKTLFKNIGVTFLGNWSFVTMFPCWSLRDDCVFHWNLQILMKFADLDSEIHHIQILKSANFWCGIHWIRRFNVDAVDVINQNYISFRSVINYGFFNERPMIITSKVCVLKFWASGLDSYIILGIHGLEVVLVKILRGKNLGAIFVFDPTWPSSVKDLTSQNCLKQF